MKRLPHKRTLLMTALAAASLTAPRTYATAQGHASPQSAGGTSATAPGPDTAYNRPYWDSTAGGTGMGTLPGRGGSSRDSAYGRDTLWSSPNNQPATPGTGLPNSMGSGLPGSSGMGTGSPGSSGNGGTGIGGSGTRGDSSYGTPRNGSGTTAPNTAPNNGGGTLRDSIGAPDWMERG